MITLASVLQKITNLTETVNSMIEKAKKTDQFPYQANLNSNSKIRVYHNGNSEFITVSQLLPSAEESENKVLDYTIQWIPGTYKFKITVRKYIFNGILHTNTIYAERTLGASDLVYNRFDSFLIDADEQIIVWPGDAVEFPYPKEFDLDTYVLINFFRVDANTTEPAGLNEILVFNEGTGAPGEWTMDYSSGTLNTTKFSSGAKCIKLVNKQSVAATAAVNFEGRFIKDVLIDVFCETAGNNRLRFSFWIANTMRVGDITVSHGQFNFNAFLIGQWQTIVIPGSAFSTSWGNSQYNYLWMNNDRSGSTVYLDNVRIQQTDIEQVSGTNHTHAQLSVLEQITQALINAWNAAVTKLSGIEANATADQTGAEIKALYEAEADTNAFTDAEKTKLANAETPHFKGLHTSEAALIIAHPAGVSGDFADVDAGVGADVARWIWDVSDDKWVVQSGVIAGETSASIKAKYEANADTNAFTDDEKTKLGTIEANADVTDAVNVGSALNSATAKATPVDTDIFSLFDTVLKKVTWANIKTTLKTYFDTLYQPIGGGTGSGDMVLADDQTVSGLKTFLNLKLGLRNVANTFTSFFTNANTAVRTYTLPNKSMTVAGTDDVATKMNLPTGGIISYLPKFITATTMGLSRLLDTGTKLGVGTVNTPTKDITLRKGALKEIGVEQSNSFESGTDLRNAAGRTINYAINSDFEFIDIYTGGFPLGSVFIDHLDTIWVSTKNQGTIWYKTLASNSFISTNIVASWHADLIKFSDGEIWYLNAASVYKVLSGQTTASIIQNLGAYVYAIELAPNGNIYVTTDAAIWMAVDKNSAFINLNATVKDYRGIAIMPNGDVFIAALNSDIYKRTNGVGTFSPTGQTSRSWGKMHANSSGVLYACLNSGGVYISENGILPLVYSGTSSDGIIDIAGMYNGNVFGVKNADGIYVKVNDALGTPDLDGGTNEVVAGTGKGTGKSRIKFSTGQKTASGTDMQVETLREYIDENGYHVYVSIPSYANDAAADADTNLPNGAAYKITGNRTIFHKP